LSILNKMHRGHGEKTESAPKFWLIGALILLILISVLVALHSNGTVLNADGEQFKLEVETSPAGQAKGLGGRSSLPQDKGMLFVFPTVAIQCFWMKDMKFPIDMIWTNPTKQVVHIQANVSPSTYPNTFCPSTPAKYVIELNAGATARANITTSQTLNF